MPPLHLHDRPLLLLEQHRLLVLHLNLAALSARSPLLLQRWTRHVVVDVLVVLGLIGKHGSIGRPRGDHKMLLLLLLRLQILLNGLIRDLVLRLGHAAQIRAPREQTKANDQVEQGDICDEPPIEYGRLGSALVLRAAPDLHLHEKHARTDEKVKTEEQLGDRLETFRHLDDLEKQEEEDQTPEGEDEAGCNFEIGLGAVFFDHS